VLRGIECVSLGHVNQVEQRAANTKDGRDGVGRLLKRHRAGGDFVQAGATTPQIMATPKNTNPNPKIQKVPKPIAKQIQPAVTAEDFGAGGATGSGGGFIYSARSNAGWVSTSLTELLTQS